MRVAIAGAGAVGRSIARELIENGHEVLLARTGPALAFGFVFAAILVALVSQGLTTALLVLAVIQAVLTVPLHAAVIRKLPSARMASSTS